MLIELVRLTRDVEMTEINGTPLGRLALVYDVGFGDKKRPVWVEASLWGKRATSLAQYLTKGTQLVLYADDVETNAYTRKDGTVAAAIRCRVSDIKLAGGNRQQGQQQGQQQPAQNDPAGFDNFDDDIPF